MHMIMMAFSCVSLTFKFLELFDVTLNLNLLRLLSFLFTAVKVARILKSASPGILNQL